LRNITNLIEGESATIADCDCLRLLEHGFVPGTNVTVYKKLFDLTSVYLRGAIISYRDEDYRKVTLKEESIRHNPPDGKKESSIKKFGVKQKRRFSFINFIFY